MKMSPETYAELKRELQIVAEEYDYFLEDVRNSRMAYVYFNEVMFNRHNDDSHPAFLAGKKRLLPFTGRGKWLANFYTPEALDDIHIHIRTALKRIFPNAFGVPK